MKVTKCDICGNMSEEWHKVKKVFNWFRFSYDSQGGSWDKLDICHNCREAFVDFVAFRRKEKP